MNEPARELLDLARGGDLAAASRLIEIHHARLYAFLRRLAGSDADASELTQRTFTRAWTALGRFEGRSTLASWLHGIALNVFRDWHRANHRFTERTDDWWHSLPASDPTPDQSTADRDEAAMVYAAVERLEEPLRMTLHLHYYQGLSIEETAGTLDLATSTVKYRVRQALGELQRVLARERRVPRCPAKGLT